MSVQGPWQKINAIASHNIAAAGTTNSTSVQCEQAVNYVTLQVVCTVAGGTSPSIVLTPQWSIDGVNWSSNDTTSESFAAIIAPGSVVKQFTPKGTMVRLQEVVTGTTPSITYSVNSLTN